MTGPTTGQTSGPVSGRQVVYLVRHGRTALNADGRLRGLLDPPLDQVGRAEVESLAAALARLPTKPARVMAGPLRRTHDTAIAIALATSAALVTDQRLIDRDYGPWTGQPTDEVRAQFGAALDPLPDAEPVTAVAARAQEVLNDTGRYPGGPIVLVSHDAVLRALLAAIEPSLGEPSGIRLRTASWSRLDPVGPEGQAGQDEVRWRVVRVDGDAAALGEAR